MKQLEEQIEKSSSYSTILDKALLFCFVHFFSNTTLNKQAIKAKTNKRDHIKLKSTHNANETINKVKRQSKKWETMHDCNPLYNMQLITKINKELNSKKKPD